MDKRERERERERERDDDDVAVVSKGGLFECERGGHHRYRYLPVHEMGDFHLSLLSWMGVWC